MNRSLLVTLAAGLALGASAQTALTQYDICPNWTATDINGNVHTLYDYLDQGYTVVMDMSTTWCAPCAQLSFSHVLDSLYTTYGPGTPENKVMVFLIESDPSTDLADLNGSSMGTPDGQTLGDWVTGTPYPIIDDASIAELVGVNGFPTVYDVCPSRMISNGLFIDGHLSEYWAGVQNCDHYDAAGTDHDAALLGFNSLTYCADPVVPLSTRLFNVGTAPLTTANIEAVSYYDNAVVSSTTWNGNLATYQWADVPLPSWNAPAYEQAIYYRMATPDDDAANDSTQTSYEYVSAAVSPTTQVSLEVLTDDHGGEVNWRLMRVDPFILVDEVVADTYADNTLYTHTWNLVDGGCYEFYIFDNGQDGLQPPGYYRVLANGNTLLDHSICHHEEGWGVYLDLAYFHVDAGGTGVQETTAAQDVFTVGPVPASTHVVLNLTGGPDAQLTVRDATGRAVVQRKLTAVSTTVELSDQPDGLYFFTVASNNGSMTRKVVVSR